MHGKGHNAIRSYNDPIPWRYDNRRPLCATPRGLQRHVMKQHQKSESKRRDMAFLSSQAK